MSDTTLKVRRVVSNFVFHMPDNGAKRLLLLKRSDEVRNYQGLWCTVSGSIEGDETPKACALRELEEEAGFALADLTLLRQGTEMIVEAREKNISWHVTPFMWSVSHDKVKIDWEHTEFQWITPETLSDYALVPDLDKTYHHINNAM